MRKNLKTIINFIIIYFLNSFIFPQSLINSNSLTLPKNNSLNKIKINFDKEKTPISKIHNTKKNYFNISFNLYVASNSGHSNIDNSAEFYAPGPFSKLVSARMEYANQWISIELEPYTISHDSFFRNHPVYGTFQSANHHNAPYKLDKEKMGFRQSRLILHYKGLGIGYGYMSHWWGPGFHSALALTSNSPSQRTYSIGTFKDIRLGNFSFNSQIIVMPYEGSSKTQLYFSGLKSHLSHHSKSTIITVGLHRTYLSGNFKDLSSTTNSIDNWTMSDAVKLVLEPIFGQNKIDLEYTRPGTPGFDAWDEILTGFIKIYFPDNKLEIYADLASDDNRANLFDLRAHWDHTLGYQLGVIKYQTISKYTIFTGVEYLSTKVSNTFNPSFYRGGPNTANYYNKPIYDYFSYQGRRMGAHSGSSSDDLIFMFGISNKKSIMFLSFNKERHGIKSKVYPELKTELALTYNYKISPNHTLFITLEKEKIKNYSFIQNNSSLSRLAWIGYSFSIN